MSTNATLKPINLGRNPMNNLKTSSIVKKRHTMVDKTKNLPKVIKSKKNNENDKNCNNLNQAADKEIEEAKIKDSDINDVNVTMTKDDSALKENEVEKVSKENIMEDLGIGETSKVTCFSTEVEDKCNIQPVHKPCSSLNYENIKINLNSGSKFSSEEYRKLCTRLVTKDYSNSIIAHLFDEEEVNEDFLKCHKITERMRCRMIDWMIEVLTNYHCEDQTFFIAVGLMDRYFKSIENVKSLQPAELHLIGVVSMFLGSKYQDIYPLRLKVVYEKIGHKKLTMEEIKQKEEELTKMLNYDVNKPNTWDFINFFLNEIFNASFNNFNVGSKALIDKYLNEEDKNEKEVHTPLNKLYTKNMLNLLNHVAVYLAKMNCHDYQLMTKRPSLVAASTIYVAIKICEQINKEEYINDYFLKKLINVSNKTENEIIKCAQKILYNAQNFDTIFSGLENLKKVHFNAIIELKYTK